MASFVLQLLPKMYLASPHVSGNRPSLQTFGHEWSQRVTATP